MPRRTLLTFVGALAGRVAVPLKRSLRRWHAEHVRFAFPIEKHRLL